MRTSVALFGDSLREAANPWLEELGKSDRDRLQKLLNLSITEKTRLSDVLNTLFYDEDPKTALANLTRLRNRLNEVGEPWGLSFKVDTKKKSPPTERTVWFTGPDAAVLRVTQFSKDASAEVQGKVFIPSKGIATTGSAMAAGKRVVRFFVSYAHEDKTLVDALMKALGLQFKASKVYELQFWMDHDILVGQKWNERILHAIEESDFGLFMVSPAFLGSDYIGENEIPPFVGEGKRKPVIPVGMVPVSFGRHELKGLEENQIFLKGQRTYDHMHRSVDKNDFAHQLFLAIEKQLDTWFDGPRSSSVEVSVVPNESVSPPLICAKDMESIMCQPEKTQHFQRTRGFAHHLAQREVLDSAKASLGDARDALDELETWAVRADGPPFFALLGEVGIGKTTTLKEFTRQLIEKRQKEPAKYPLPIYIDLRDYVSDKPETVPTIEELLTSVIQRSWRVTDRTVTAGDLLRLVREEGALIIFDGLDEKIVQLTQNRARDFIRTLWSVLPQAMLSPSGVSPAASYKGKMLLSCRSHYFRDVWSQNAMLTGEDREGIDRSQYPAFCLLPLNEGQIRGYLTSFLGNEKRGGEAFNLIASIHNLLDLAERPYLLSLISGRLGELEALQMRGETVNAARLYDLVVRSWLSRDDGKHHLDAMHKRRLMEALAAALWRSGEKQWDVDRLEEWFDDFLHQNPAIASAYANKDRSLLKEDLRTATFVLRPDTEAKHFRFAHTSLQEYFLASHLFRALADKAVAEWDMPMVSLETLDFLGQILTTNPSSVAIASLERILGGDCLPAACLAFKYWLEAIKRVHPEPQPQQTNLAGADFDEWHIQGRSKDRPLNLRGANLSRVKLNRARVEFVDLTDADLSELQARQSLFLRVDAARSKLAQADLAGLQWRRGSLQGAVIKRDVLELAELLLVETPDLDFVPVARMSKSLATLKVYTGHRGVVTTCSWNPHGSAVVSGSSDGSIKLWDAASGRELINLSGHASSIKSCTWNPDGSRLLSGSSDNTLKTWDAASGKELFNFCEDASSVSCCSWSPDGSRLLSGSNNNTVKIRDASSGKVLLVLPVHVDRVRCCVWSHDGSRLLLNCTENTLKMWDTKTGRELLSISQDGHSIMCCAWSPDGSRLLLGSSDSTLHIWDAVSGRKLIGLSGHEKPVRCCAWSPDGTHILSGSDDNSLILWDAISGREFRRLSGHSSYVFSCDWSPDGSHMLSGSWDKTLKIWKSTSGKELLSLSGHSSPIWCCAWSPDSSRLLTGNSENVLHIWDAISGKELLTISGHKGSISCCAWNPDSSRVLSGSADHTLKLWDVSTGKELLSIYAHEDHITCCAWSPNGEHLLSGSWDNTLKIWNAVSGAEIFTLSAHYDFVTCCDWSPDGSRLLSGSNDNTLKIWDASSGKELLCLSGHASPVRCCAWSPDGSSLLSGSDDNTLRVWDAKTGRQLLNLSAHASSVWCCAWSPDGSRLLSGSDDTTLKIWDAHTGRELHSLSGHANWIHCCVWRPDSSQLVSGSWDNTLKLWDASTGECLWTGHSLPDNQSAIISGDRTEILHATPEAWRWLGWEERDAKGRFIRRLPAEAFGPIPGMED